MSKQVKTLGELTEAQVEQVNAVISDMAAHTYSTSRVYAAHNLVFDLTEKPESCASCLKTRATNLRNWLAEQDQPKTAKVKKDAAPAKDAVVKKLDTTTDAAGNTEGAQGAGEGDQLEASNVKTKAGEDLAVNLSRDAEGNYLGITDAEGKALKPGTYTLENGDTIAVQPGGKSNYKPNEDLT